MVIRRIREHVVAHNWFAVAVDVGIVVVGVFLGTQANNWNETRVERAAASAARREIIDDLRTNEVLIASRKAYYSAVRSHALAVLDQLERPGDRRGAPFLVDAYQASQVWLRPLARAGYDEMTGAGLSRSIGDRETRTQLTAYYNTIRQFDVTALGMTSYRERLRRSMPYRVQLAVKHQCPERVANGAGGDELLIMPDRCALDLDPIAVAAAVARIDSPGLVEDLNRHIADLDQKLLGAERVGRMARELRLDLESAESD